MRNISTRLGLPGFCSGLGFFIGVGIWDGDGTFVEFGAWGASNEVWISLSARHSRRSTQKSADFGVSSSAVLNLCKCSRF